MEKIKILWNGKEYHTVPYFNRDEVRRILEANMINYDLCEKLPNVEGSCAYVYPDWTVKAIVEQTDAYNNKVLPVKPDYYPINPYPTIVPPSDISHDDII